MRPARKHPRGKKKKVKPRKDASALLANSSQQQAIPINVGGDQESTLNTARSHFKQVLCHSKEKVENSTTEKNCAPEEEYDSLLECPVCLETPRKGPVFSCANGHLIVSRFLLNIFLTNKISNLFAQFNFVCNYVSKELVSKVVTTSIKKLFITVIP